MRYIALFITLLLSCLCSRAQTDEAFSWPDKGVWPESPKAATIREVTSPLPSLLTGAAEFDVPLYTLEAEDYSLPFQFRYHSNGIRVTDDPCPWGYGWTLSPSIRISRRIIGRPDGLFTPVFDKSFLSHNECYHAMTDSLLDLSWGKPRLYPDFYTDPAPDIFTVQLPGKTFSVIFQKSGNRYEAVTAGCDEYKVESNDFLTWFRITDPAGNIYTFDVEGEYSQSPVFCTEWLPGSIELPSGNKIRFSYIECNSATQNMPDLSPKSYRFIKGDNNPPPSGTVSYTHPYFRGSKHLSSVEFDGEKISITYDGVRDGHRCIKSLAATIDGKEVTTTAFTYDAERKMLQSIVTPEGEYSFEYDPHTFHEGSGRDWWGFSNGKGAGGSPSVSIDLTSMTGNQYADIKYHGADRSIDADNMQARMLVKATYPTGGSARWEYEPHRFSPIGMSTAVGASITGFSALSEGGGLRVKSISLYENDNDTHPRTTRFYYGENRDGKAAPTPDTFIEAYPVIEFCQNLDSGGNGYAFFQEVWSVIIGRESNYMQYRFGEVPVWYSCVESVSDEGKTVTRFEDIIGDNDIYYSASNFTNWITEAYHAFSDGPQMTSRTLYRSDADGGYSPVLSETMDYEVSDGPTCRGHHIKRNLHSSPQIVSAPDFSGNDKVDYLVSERYIVDHIPPSSTDAGLINNAYSVPYYIGTLDIYKQDAFTIFLQRERLQSKTVTEYRENGSYTTSQALEYVPGTGLVAKTTDRVIPDRTDTGKRGAAGITATLSYADAAAGGAESAMAEANIIGVALSRTMQDGSATLSVRAQMNRYGDASVSRVFRPSRVYSLRGTDASDEYYAADLEWNARGRLLSSKDRAGVDSHVKETTWQNLLSAADAPYLRTNYDGLGRPVSKVTAWKENGWKYISTATDYDTMGRLSREWNSSPVGSDSPAAEEVAASATEFYGDTQPYCTVAYEASQRNLSVATQKPGEIWHNGNHRATVRRLVNDNGDYACAYYSLGSDMKLTHCGNYARGALTVEETTDEDGITYVTFTDFRGRLIMQRHGSARTYYVYNDYGDLCYILPPILSERSYEADDAELAEHAYISRFDRFGRPVYTKSPGCSPQQFYYDNAGRLVAETGPDLGSKWRFHFYDNAGREVLVTEGTYPADYLHTATFRVPRTAARGNSSADGLKGYTVKFPFPADNAVKQAVYYDGYTLLPSRDNDGASYLTAPSGLQTGLWAASDDGGKGVTQIFWYDSHGRRSYEITETDRHRLCQAIRYTYDGKVSKKFELIYDTSTNVWKHWNVERAYTYDNAGRLQSETAILDSCTVLIRYVYDGAGQLSRKEKGLAQPGAGLSATTFRDANTTTCDYSYDVHGWPVKTVTSVPATAEPWNGQPGISRPYYKAASLGHNISAPDAVFRRIFTETIHYADGNTPRYNGTPSARGLSAGGRYDYRYDELDRLIGADYTAPDSNPDADFSTGYTYDLLSRPLTIKRRGVVDIDGTTEIFGQLDNLALSYNGATLDRVQSDITGETGRDFYGRTGWANGTYMTAATLEFNSAGRISRDNSRMISSVTYNTQGFPVRYSISDSASDNNSPRQERAYDATGRKLRQTDYEAVRGQIVKTSDRRYVDAFTFNADTLERIEFTDGYFDGQGNPHFLFTDWQGNVTLATSAEGRIEQNIGYYPYGEPWREPSGQHARLFAGKERVSGMPAGDYDFGPRNYRSTFLLWDSRDIKATEYPQWSPWLYCGANPIKNIDPSGNEIQMSSLYDYDIVSGHSMTQAVIDDLNIQTGLQLRLDKDKKLQYAKNDDGSPLISKTKDKKGREIDAGSKTARKLLTKAIDNKIIIKVSRGNTSATNSNEIGLNYEQITEFIEGAVGVDGKTLGFGMVFLHELHHTPIIGYKDNLEPFKTGPVVDNMNVIRKELNDQGFNYGERRSYVGILTNEGVITPFDYSAQLDLQNGLQMSSRSCYIKTKNHSNINPR